MNDPSDFKRLQWQCRRGIKEVEVLLLPFFETQFNQLDRDDQQLFECLLACHDVDLFDWFTGRGKPEDLELARLVDAILQFVGSRVRT